LRSGRGDVTGNEDEYVHRAAETVVSERDPAHHVVWNVVQEKEPVRHSEKQMEPRIALLLRENCLGIHWIFTRSFYAAGFYAMAIVQSVIPKSLGHIGWTRAQPQ
jgi:hypothetical protein